MKKTLALMASIVFVGTFLTVPAVGAVKAGAVCAKAGATSTAAGKKFTCFKSGKKLIWDKGVINKPSSKSIPKPSPTPSPTHTQSQPQIPVGLWQATQFKILEQFKSLQPTKIQELNFVLSPTSNKVNAKKLQDSYQEPITFLSNLYVNANKVTFLVMNENDKDWWLEKLAELKSKQPSDWWGGSHCEIKPQSHCGYGSTPEEDGAFHFGQFLGSEFVWIDRDYTIAYHESIHVYQIGLLGNRMRALPHWFAEGQANYLGYTFSHRFVDSRLQRNSEIRRVKSFPNVEKYDDKQWYEWLAKIDSDSDYTFSNQLGYSVGELILEALYNENDFRKVHEWMVTIKNGSDYKTGFKTIFGQDYDSWLMDTAAPYLNSQI